MKSFVLALIGAILIVAVFLGLGLSGQLAGNASFIIGWFTCGLYALFVFCNMGGQPENVGGTSIVMILLGALMLCFVLTLMLSCEPEPPQEFSRN